MSTKQLYFITIAILLSSTSLMAQKMFKNTNNELCIELYKISDDGGTNLVYMVIDYEHPLEKNDSIILQKWHTLKETDKSTCTQKWTSLGKRIEIEKFPCTQVFIKTQPFQP